MGLPRHPWEDIFVICSANGSDLRTPPRILALRYRWHPDARSYGKQETKKLGAEK
jgi:hypothetical protein